MSVIITCNVFAWPAPSVDWLTPPSSANTIISESTQSSVHTSTTLQFPITGFQQSDSGKFYCSVIEMDTSFSQEVSLTATVESPATTSPPPSACMVSSATVWFQFRVLTSDCSSWSEATQQRIVEDLRVVFAGGILSQCRYCSVNLTIESVNCSQFTPEASVFRGMTSNDEIARTQATFCAIREWFEFQPLIRVNGRLYPIDPNCTLQVDSPSGRSNKECTSGTVAIMSPSSTSGLLAGFISAMALIFISVMVVIVPLVWLR